MSILLSFSLDRSDSLRVRLCPSVSIIIVLIIIFVAFNFISRFRMWDMYIFHVYTVQRFK